MKELLKNHRWLRGVILIALATAIFQSTAFPWSVLVAAMCLFAGDGLLFAFTERSFFVPKMRADEAGNAFIPEASGSRFSDERQESSSLDSTISGASDRPVEVRRTLAALSAMEENFDEISFSEVQSMLIDAVIQNPQDVIRVVREKGVPPEQYAYSMMVNMLANTLESGTVHIYRGVLSMQGEMVMSMFEKCVSELESIGIEDPNRLAKLRADVARNVKETG